MADKFDPYREALIVEVETQWPDEYDDWEPTERARVERLLHANPDKAEQAKAKPALAGWFVGKVMKATGGKASPQAVNEQVKAKLGIE